MRIFSPYADKATRKVIEENFVSDTESDSEPEEEASSSGSEEDEEKSDDTTHPKRKSSFKGRPSCSQKGRASSQKRKQDTDGR